MLCFIKSKTLALLGLTTLSAASLAACTVQTVDVDPRGVAVDLEASWTIDGAAADQASCDAAGISTVQLVFVEGAFEGRYNDFLFNCSDGSVIVDKVLARGTYSAFWEAQDSLGRALQASGIITVDATGTVARPDIPDFGTFDPRGTDVALEASWTIEGSAADQAACDGAGIDTVELVFLDGTIEYRYPEFVFECEAGSYVGTADLATGTYAAFWEAQDSTGVAVQKSANITVDATGTVARPDIPDFSSQVVVTNDAVLTVTWDTDIGTDIVGTNCSGVDGVNFIAYALHNNETDDLIKDYGAMSGCTNEITIPESDIDVGTSYRVDIDGGPEDGSWYWQGSCFFTAEEGGTTASCEAADVRYRLAVDLVWDSNEGPDFSAADCTGAGVEFMNYELRPTGGSAIVSESQIACGNEIIFEEPLVTGGADQTYELTIIGHDDGTFGGEWTLLCVGLKAGVGIMDNGACEIGRG